MAHIREQQRFAVALGCSLNALLFLLFDPCCLTQVPIRSAAVPPEHLPVGHGVSVDPVGGQGLEGVAHRQADSHRHSGSAHRSEHQRSGTGGTIQTLSQQSRRVQKESSSAGEQTTRGTRAGADWDWNARTTCGCCCFAAASSAAASARCRCCLLPPPTRERAAVCHSVFLQHCC